MSKKIINIANISQRDMSPALPSVLEAPTGSLLDMRARPLQDLRISLTDRCNFRCVYCMPREIFDKDHNFLPRSSLLSFEEIIRITRIFVAHGVNKIRLTGGEPLLRKHIEKLIDDWQGKSSFEILNMQLKEFEKWYHLAITHKQQAFTVIHGVGKGKLKEEIHNHLKIRKEVKSFINQYTNNFGYGATEKIFQ